MQIRDTKSTNHRAHHSDHKRVTCSTSDYCFFHKSELQLLSGFLDSVLASTAPGPPMIPATLLIDFASPFTLELSDLISDGDAASCRPFQRLTKNAITINVKDIRFPYLLSFAWRSYSFSDSGSPVLG